MYVSNNGLSIKQSEFDWNSDDVFVSFLVKMSPTMIQTEVLLNLFMQFTGFSLYDTSNQNNLNKSRKRL